MLRRKIGVNGVEEVVNSIVWTELFLMNTYGWYTYGAKWLLPSQIIVITTKISPWSINNNDIDGNEGEVFWRCKPFVKVWR